MSSIAKRCYEAIFLGEFGSNSHPIHPATVHFPIAFLSLANVINLVYGSILYLPKSPFLARTETNISALSISGYYVNILGILSSIPALLTGNAELVAMLQANGMYETDHVTQQRRMVPKVKITLIHAALNDIVAMGAVYNWLRERNVPDFRPAGHQVVLSAVAMVTQLLAAYLGGSLIYEHGVGVQRMGEAKEKKMKRAKDE